MGRILKPPANVSSIIVYSLAFFVLLYNIVQFFSQKFPSSCVVDSKFDINYVEENLESFDADNSQLIQYTRIRHLTPPSKQPYNLNRSQAICTSFCRDIRKIFRDKRGGIFIEAGAHDGESSSHSLYLEKHMEWKGLLVECNPTLIPLLIKKRRKAWMAHVCLSTTGQATTLSFSHPVSWTYSGRIGETWNVSKEWIFFDVPAIPLYTIVAALGWKQIDYFSFDIEGQELNVFKTFPFDKVIFKILVVEVHFYTEQENQELHELLTSNDYILFRNITVDYYYYHKNFENELSLS